MRLFDVLKRYKIPFPDGTELIIADPVWSEIDEGPDRKWKSADFPNLAPPFPSFCIEARSSQEKRLTMLAHFKDVTHWVNEHHIATRQERPMPEGTTWILTMTTYAGIQDGAAWTCLGYPGLVFLHVGPDGRWLDAENDVSFWMKDEFVGKSPEFFVSHAALPQHGVENSIPTMFTALSLLHCHNVHMENVIEPRQQRRAYERKYGLPLSEYKVLTIRPVGKTPRGNIAPAVKAVGLNREHIVRGHFKTFTDEAPLFGRLTGMWWWESAVRGNPKRGEVVKDYNVIPE